MLSTEKPDVLNICTPSGLHADCAVLAADYGVNVLSEKPLDITKEKLDFMIDTCRKKDGACEKKSVNLSPSMIE